MLMRLWVKFKPIIMYGIVGCMATAINIGVYLLCYKLLCITNVISNSFAWIISVLFAFITNKLFVFESKDMSRFVFLNELLKFVLARLSTGLIDILIMFITVDVMGLNAAVWKVVSNIIVIIGNYILSKFLVFSKLGSPKKEQ